jgi:hypothetical protein
MLVILCKACNKEITSHPAQARSCGCPNMTMILNDKISAVDLTQVQIISGIHNHKSKDTVLTPEDLEFQEQRKIRKIRKLEFEVR